MLMRPVKTRRMHPPKDEMWGVLKQALVDLPERSVVVVASKVVAIHQGRCVPMERISRDELAMREAEWYLPREQVPGGHILLTIKHHNYVASSGIDASNSNGYWVMWPEKPMETARNLWERIRETYGLREVAVVMADSHSLPMRRGTVGFSLGYWGFNPVKDYRGVADIFGKPLEVTVSNLADAIAAAAVLLMGEAGEQTPVVVGTNLVLEFSDAPELIQGQPAYTFELEEDLFGPLFSGDLWLKGGGGITREELQELQRT